MKKPHEQPGPPLWAIKLLHLYCSEYYLDEVQGDLTEAYEARRQTMGRLKANLLFTWDVLRFMKPYIIKGIPQSNHFNSKQNPTDMFKNYLKTSIRSLMQNKVYTLVSTSGLAVGMACCILIGLFIREEFSYDKFVPDHGDIYRVAVHHESVDMNKDYAVSHIMLGPILEDTYPEVEASARLHRLYFHPEITVLVGDRSFAETKMQLADNEFFDVFSIKFIEGSAKDALTTNRHVVLTKKTARRYFGDSPALNKVLKLDFGRELVVSGVIEDLPENSHMDFDLLGSLEFMSYLRRTLNAPDWTALQVCTYVKLSKGFDSRTLESKLPVLVDSHGKGQIEARFGEGFDYKLFLQPLTSIHLNSHLDAELGANGNINHLYIVGALAIFILAISSVNFINLATARSAERAKEVGIRKVMGSSRRSLLNQFLTESSVVCIVAFVLAVVIVMVSFPIFNQLVDKQMPLTVLLNPLFLGCGALFSLLVGIAAGWYPAIVISSINSAVVLKGQFKNSRKGIWLRNSLVVFQFVISIGLIAGTIIIGQQMNYVSSKPLGFTKEHVLLIKHPLSLGQQDQVQETNLDRLSLDIVAKANQKIEVFKSELRDLSNVLEVGGTFQVMGKRFSSNLFQKDDAKDQMQSLHMHSMDYDFISAVGIEVLQGRSFSKDFNDAKKALLNESALKVLGWENPIGHKLTIQDGSDDTFEVIGVVKDYHFQSLHEEVQPLILMGDINHPTYFPTALAVRIKGAQISETLDEIEEKWKQFVPAESLNITFLDGDLEKLYIADRASERIFRFFALVAILLACIGLFGLATYIAQQRTKEIGIRKVLGAHVATIIVLLMRNFAQLIVLAFILTLPATYFGMNQWLDTFVYHINVGAIPFLVALVITIILSLITIGYQAIKAALINPAKTLRSE